MLTYAGAAVLFKVPGCRAPQRQATASRARDLSPREKQRDADARELAHPTRQIALRLTLARLFSLILVFYCFILMLSYLSFYRGTVRRRDFWKSALVADLYNVKDNFKESLFEYIFVFEFP